MDYGQLLKDAWRVVWDHKFLLVLGFLAALGAGAGSSGNTASYNFSADDIPPGFGGRVDLFWVHFAPLITGLICLAIFLGMLLWLVRLTAQAGLISAADRLYDGEKVTLGQALRSGLGKLGRMAGISLLLYGPFILVALVLVIAVLALVGSAIGYSFANVSELDTVVASLGLGVACLALLLCAMLPLLLVATILLPFAQRAAVLEDMGATASLGRAWQVIRSNPAEVAILILLFVAIGFVYGAAVAIVVVPLMALLFMPMVIGLVVDGTLGATNVVALVFGGLAIGFLGALLNALWTSYRSTAMTLAYRQLAKATDAPKRSTKARSG
jgi:hypothetical protein